MGDIDANGTVNVSASDKSTGKKQSVTVRTSGGLSDKDIERMVQEAEEMRETDSLKKEGVTVKNDAETLGYQVEKQLSELKEKMSTADADELKKKLEDLRTALATEDIDLDDVKKKTSELQEKSWAVTQAAYQAGSDQSDAGSGSEKKEEEKKEEKAEK